jgi:hypothetical protein
MVPGIGGGQVESGTGFLPLAQTRTATVWLFYVLGFIRRITTLGSFFKSDNQCFQMMLLQFHRQYHVCSLVSFSFVD